MFKRISELLSAIVQADDQAPDADDDDLQIAAAVLLVEMSVADGEAGPEEQATIRRILREHFELSGAEVEHLLGQARDAQEHSTQFLRFTRALKDRYSEAERAEIIEMLWEVAYADGVLHAHEDLLLRRLSGLIYVSDRERGEARRRVLARQKSST